MRHIQRKQSKTVLYIVTLCIGACLALGVYIYMKPSSPASPPPQRTKTPHKTDRQAITLKIGATRVTPLQEDYMEDSSLWRLVNKTNPLTDSQYEPHEMTKAPIAIRPGLREDEQSLRTILVPDLRAMVKQAATDGVELTLGSGYRSPALQKFFFDNYAARDGIEAANKYSALPGQSEHQTGLAMDFASGDMSCYLEQCFAETPAGSWLARHAHSYGFILRYTRDGEKTTGYQFEPWHYRYVGKELATALHDNNMLLETAWPALLETRRELIAHGDVRE